MAADDLRSLARRHLAPHFTRSGAWHSDSLPVIVHGAGCYVYDDAGRRLLDGLSGLFCVNIGHGRTDIAAAAAKQLETLPYATNWSGAHPPAVEAATLIAGLAPGDLESVFFVNSGSEAVESALKFARQYHQANGEPQRTKVIARDMAYHGTSLGALSVTGIPKIREPFEPLLPGVRHVPNTLGQTVPSGESVRELPCVCEIERVIAEEGPETIGALFAEPVQNGRGALVPPDGYWQELRAICDRYGILLVADEVISAFGRLGSWFGSELFGVVPDLVTFAKGSTSAYAPLGGMLIRRPVLDTLFAGHDGGFAHGATFGGHPLVTAVATANLQALQAEDALGNVRTLAPRLQAGLEEIRHRHSVVGDIRGTGFFHAIEFTADREAGRELTAEESTHLLRETFPAAMKEAGLVTRPDDRGATMIMVSPPLIADEAVIDELVEALDHVTGAAAAWLQR